MQLHRRQAQLLGNLSVLDLTSFIEGHATHAFGHEARRGNRRTATECFELDVDNFARRFVHFDLQLHDITAGRCTHETGAHVRRRLGERAHVARTLVMIDNLVMPMSISSHDKSPHGYIAFLFFFCNYLLVVEAGTRNSQWLTDSSGRALEGSQCRTQHGSLSFFVEEEQIGKTKK